MRLMAALFVFLLLASPALAGWVLCDESKLGTTQSVQGRTFSCVKEGASYQWVTSTTPVTTSTTTVAARGCGAGPAQTIFARVFSIVNILLGKA